MNGLRPAPGTCLALVASVRTRASELDGLLCEPTGAATPTLGWATAVPAGVASVPLGQQLGPNVERLGGSGRAEWLDVVPELTARLQHPWRQLGLAERYLAGVARVLISGAPIVALERPGSWLARGRVLRLIEDLLARKRGVVVVERQLRLVQALAAPTWLVDQAVVVGPREALTLLEDADAWTLCFGGTLGVGVGDAGTDGAATS